MSSERTLTALEPGSIDLARVYAEQDRWENDTRLTQLSSLQGTLKVVCESHEVLRAQLAACQQERDEARREAERLLKAHRYQGASENPWRMSRWLLDRAEAAEAALAKLRDPDMVHAAMLRGDIATPSIRQMLHLHGADALAKWDALSPSSSPAGTPMERPPVHHTVYIRCFTCGNDALGKFCSPGCQRAFEAPGAVMTGGSCCCVNGDASRCPIHQTERPSAEPPKFTAEEVEAWMHCEARYENHRTLAMLRDYARLLSRAPEERG